VAVTRESVGEYATRQRERYQQASRVEKGRLLDEVVAVTGFHRKAAIRLLSRRRRRGAGQRRGRPRQYGSDVAEAARVVWEAAGYIGARRLQPFVNELLDRLKSCGEARLHPDTERLLRQASAATLQRLLAPYRSLAPPRGQTITTAGAWLKHQIPVRTFADWDDARPGFLEIDLVAHCGESTQGFYLCTLTSVDIATGWVELQAVWGKGQQRVQGGVHALRRQLPMPLLGLDSDNGSEFINHAFLAYCRQHHITFTRSRPYRRTTAPTSSRRTGHWCATWSAMVAWPPAPPTANWPTGIAWCGSRPTSFNRSASCSRSTMRAPRCIAATTAPQTPFQRLCAANILSSAKLQEVQSCIRASIHSSSSASCKPSWTVSGI
jgi:hypothetical protein